MVVRGTVNHEDTQYCRLQGKPQLLVVQNTEAIFGRTTNKGEDHELDEQQKGFLDMFR